MAKPARELAKCALKVGAEVERRRKVLREAQLITKIQLLKNK